MNKNSTGKKLLIYNISNKTVKYITVYFSVLLTLSIILIIYILLNLNIVENDILLYTIFASTSVATMLCCLKYLKKIYKACIEKRIGSHDEMESWGNIIYFVLRPFYSIVFIILMIIAILGGFVFVTFSFDDVLNMRFFYFCTIISSLIGYSTGRVLDKFEIFSEKKIDDIIKDVNGGKTNGSSEKK